MIPHKNTYITNILENRIQPNLTYLKPEYPNPLIFLYVRQTGRAGIYALTMTPMLVHWSFLTPVGSLFPPALAVEGMKE